MTEITEGRQGIDLEKLAVVVQATNAAIALRSEGQLLIKLQAIVSGLVVVDSDGADNLLLDFENGKSLKLTPIQTEEFWQKLKLIALMVEDAMQKQRLAQEAVEREALASLSQQLGIKAH